MPQLPSLRQVWDDIRFFEPTKHFSHPIFGTEIPIPPNKRGYSRKRPLGTPITYGPEVTTPIAPSQIPSSLRNIFKDKPADASFPAPDAGGGVPPKAPKGRQERNWDDPDFEVPITDPESFWKDLNPLERKNAQQVVTLWRFFQGLGSSLLTIGILFLVVGALTQVQSLFNFIWLLIKRLLRLEGGGFPTTPRLQRSASGAYLGKNEIQAIRKYGDVALDRYFVEDDPFEELDGPSFAKA